MNEVVVFSEASPSTLLSAASRFYASGSARVKVGKLLAAVTVLAGVERDEVSRQTGIKASAIGRPVSIVRNGRKAGSDGKGKVTPRQASEALAGLDWATLTADESTVPYGTMLDAVTAAANVWDKFFADVSQGGGSKDPASLSDIIISAFDALGEGIAEERFTQDAAEAAVMEALAAFDEVVAAKVAAKVAADAVA